MLQANEVIIDCTYPDLPVSSSAMEVWDEAGGPLYWALLKHDKAGLYFRHPDMAKYHAMNELGSEYRELLEIFWISSMNGAERAEIKPKKKKK